MRTESNKHIIPFFSIITPTHNRAHLLSKAIESVIAQRFKDWEMIVVDDSSTDQTKEVVLGFKDHRIKYFYQENKERSAARNLGIEHAVGKFICFLDSDDYYLENHLETLYKHHEKGVFLTDLAYSEIENKLIKIPEYQNTSENNVPELWERDSFPCCCIAIKREILEKEKFDERFNIWEDYHLWFRILTEHSPVLINEYTSVVRYHQDNSAYNAKDQLERISIFLKCVKDIQTNNTELLRIIGKKAFKKKVFSVLYRFSRSALSAKKYYQAFRFILLSSKFIYDRYSAMRVFKMVVKCIIRYES